MISGKIRMILGGGHVWWWGGVVWRVGGGGGFGGDSRRRRREEGGPRANMRLIQVEECYLNIESRHNFGLEYIHIF
jgi:hypothetical protein